MIIPPAESCTAFDSTARFCGTLRAVAETMLVPGPGAVETRVAHVWLRSDGIVGVAFKSGAALTVEDSMEMNRIIRSFSDQPTRRPIITDISVPHSAEPQVRRYGASSDSLEVTLKLALMVKNPVGRMIGNAFLAARRPPYPTRLFNDEALALAWLGDGWSQGS